MCRVIIPALVASLLSGCGTLTNIQGKEFWSGEVRKPQIYGGVGNHVEEWSEISVGLIDPFFFAFLATDLTASAVADTLTIPIVIYKQVRWNENVSPD